MTSVELPQAQKELLTAVKATGKPVVVLLVTGRPMALESVDELMDALLVVWHPGTAGGDALADILSGDYSPSGHLTMSFPRCDGQIPIRYNYKSTGRPLTKEMDYTQSHKAKKNYQTCYLFTPNSPLYPFGYGLSYTQFSFTDLQVLDPEVAMGEDVRVKVRVTNIGEVPGTTVAQLYIRDKVASTTRPVRELKGFERVSLEPGASAEVLFTITAADMAFCREDMKFAQEPGEFGIWVGESCEAELEGKFIVKE
jgi:beta-glucosidase